MKARSLALVVAPLVLAACTERVAPTRPLASSATELAADGLLDLPYVPECGFENGVACPAPGLPREPPRCDRGLQLDLNGTPLNPLDDRCRNDWRHRVGAEFRGSWADWALANQRMLAVDEPINWVMLIRTHNANNNWADGETFNPNQAWSLSDQLDLGARMLAVDVHWVDGAARLCHALTLRGDGTQVHLGCGPGDRMFGYAVKEIATWMDAHPREILVLDIEHKVEGHDQAVIEPLQAFLGDRIFRVSERAADHRWPSRRELERTSRRVIIGSLGGGEGKSFGDLTHYQDFTLAGLNWGDIANFEPTREDGIVTSCGSHSDDGSVDDLQFYDNLFRFVGEDRALNKSGPFVNASEVVEIVSCNLGVNLDHLWGRHALPTMETVRPRPDADRQPHAVWSWRAGDRGDNGDAAMLMGANGRWRSEPTSEHHRFACAPVRSETRPRGRGEADWPNRKGEAWQVTERAGPWHEGGRACLDEYGDDGMVFSVPVDGRMNGRLRLADDERGDVWLNYNDIDEEGRWVINRRPTADAGADQTVECNGHAGSLVQLDGAMSSDPEGQTLSYEWQGAFGTATGVRPTVSLPVGRHVVRMIVDDGHAGVSTDEVVIDVVDTKPPEIHAASAAPAELWPPNHKMRPAEVSVSVSDVCDASPTCRIVSVTSNEPLNADGDGNTAVDWQITGPLTVILRAERAGGGSGRVYTLTVECTDAAGNASTTAVLVTVPPDRSGKAR